MGNCEFGGNSNKREKKRKRSGAKVRILGVEFGTFLSRDLRKFVETFAAAASPVSFPIVLS